MSIIQSFIRKHRILSFYILVFTISFGGFLALISSSGNHTALERSVTNPLFLSVVVVTLIGPIIAGILMTIFVYGKKDLRNLFLGYTKGRVAFPWYAVAFLATPITVFGALLPLSAISSGFIPGIISASDKLSVVLPALMVSFIGPFFEETGWTGFVVPELRKRYNIFSTGLIAGILWGAWHGLSNIWFIGNSNGSVPFVLYSLVLLFSFLPPFRVLMVWVYDRTKSLLIVYLMHASLDFFWLIATPTDIAGIHMTIWYLVWAVVIWGVVAIIAVNHGLSESKA